MTKELLFEWDPVKNEVNKNKHGIDFCDVVCAFRDPFGINFIDKKHSKNEQRFFWVGKIRDGRIVTIRYTYRNDTIRIFGAAEWRYFREQYYEKAKK